VNNIEDIIRDELIQNMNILGEEYELIDKEKYLPNHLGTRGFVDILAKDSLGRHVIIELKKSNSSAREALHEVLKYIEGIKENKSLKNDEIRVMIVSTEWSELLVPYSSFIKHTNIPVSGILLRVDDNYKPLSISIVEPLRLNNERLFSDQHGCRLYKCKDNLNKGIDSHLLCFKEKNIDDYILLILEAPEGLHEKTVASVIEGVNAITEKFGGPPSISIEKIKDGMFDYKYMIYSAIQVLSKEEYWEIIKKDSELFEDTKDFPEIMGEEELMGTLHEYAVDNSKPYYDTLEISYPAKLSSSILDSQGWKIVSVIRSGRFKENTVLTDETIIEELKGSGGTNKQYYNKTIDSNNSASFDQMKKDISICLIDNPIWRKGIISAIDEIKEASTKTRFVGQLYVYNPSNTILSLFRVVSAPTEEDALLCIPNYFLNIKLNNVTRIYFGCLIKNNKHKTLKRIISDYYNNDVFQLIFPLTWGGYESRDYQIAPDYGLVC